MPSENILSHFWDLASNDESKRLKAASQLLFALEEAQKQYDGREKVGLSFQQILSIQKNKVMGLIACKQANAKLG